MKEKVEKTRQHNSGNGIGVRIVAGILAFLMVMINECNGSL